MRPLIKICGMTSAADALYCAQAGADALGFIFYDKSPRTIEPSAAAEIIRALPPFVTPVGVFVNASRDFIASVIRETGIRVIQLSGDEEPPDCLGYSVSVVKVFRTPRDIDRVKEFSISAAMIDGTKNEMYGGSGVTPDLQMAMQLRRHHPLIVAGGLNAANVVAIVRSVRPYAIDVNSGVEQSPGKKDRRKVTALFEKIADLD
ncbi:MAG TPA: phosphoribosylanthranilate isomerase [Bacteroidota bacterium]|nr:phosphoribosylanthranilate isomerase [Bacteroidota bacterium]